MLADVTYIGGPTALLSLEGLRLLTDPTFDLAGEEYRTAVYTLHKIASPALAPESLGHVDVVLLSHDQHFDNLDRAGRVFLAQVETVLTTTAAATRLGSLAHGNAIGLATWQQIELPTRPGGALRVMGTPARHGPADGDRGPVTGFLITSDSTPDSALYISGDTVWYDALAEIARHVPTDARIDTALLFMGAARVPEVGPQHLTMTAADGVEFARAFPHATIVPLHFEGWQHYSESRDHITRVFRGAGLEHRLHWLQPGVTEQIAPSSSSSRRRGAAGG
jgi:L-ascorbate metabolism protein UlaG (beta-lactamase superfamily)